jgi:hypothetical protein
MPPEYWRTKENLRSTNQAWTHFSLFLISSFFAACFMLLSSRLILRPWGWRLCIPRKRQLILSGLHGIVYQKTELFLKALIILKNASSCRRCYRTYTDLIKIVNFCLNTFPLCIYVMEFKEINLRWRTLLCKFLFILFLQWRSVSTVIHHPRPLRCTISLRNYAFEIVVHYFILDSERYRGWCSLNLSCGRILLATSSS